MRYLTGLLIVVLAAACAVKKPVEASILAQAAATPDAATGLTLPPGYRAEIVASLQRALSVEGPAGLPDGYRPEQIAAAYLRLFRS